MNEPMTLEGMLRTVLADEVAGSVPSRLLEETLGRTSATRPSARWVALLLEPALRTRGRVVVGIPSRGVVAAAAVVALVALALVAALIGSTIVQPRPAEGSGDWTMFRGDASRSGPVTTGPVGRLVTSWTFHASGSVNAGIAIIGDTVYVPSDDGAIHAVAVAGGQERWSATLDRGPAAGVVVADGLLFTADGNGRVYALDPATGVARWRSAATFSTPLNLGAGGGSVLVAAGSGGAIAAVDERTGSTRWQTVLPNGSAVNAPAFDGTTVYASTNGGGLFALNGSDGAIRWRVDTGTDALGTPVVANGIAYVGAPSDARTGHLRAVDATTGRVIWTLDGQLATPAVTDHRLFVVSNGSLALLDEATGATRWRAAVGGVTRAPVVAGGIVYLLVEDEHRVHAFDAANGGELSHLDVDASNNCCIAVAKGLVILGTERGTVYGIGGDRAALTPAPIVPASPTPASPPAQTPAPSPSVAASPAASSPGAIAGEPVATFVARFPDPPDGLLPNPLVLDPAGHLWVSDPYSHRFAEFTLDGRFLGYWGTSGSGDGEFNLRRSNGDGCGTVGFGPGGAMYVLDCGNRRVQVFDRKRRFVRSWGGFGDSPGQFDDPIGMIVTPDGTVFVLDDVRGVVEAFDADGKVLRTIRVFDNIGGAKFNGANAFTIDAAGNLYVSQIEPDQVAEFDQAGQLVQVFGAEGEFRFSEQPGFSAVDDQGRLFVDQGPGRGDAPGIAVFAPDGRFLGGFGIRGDANGDVQWPTGLVLDGKGSLYLGDVGPGPDTGTIGSIKRFRLLPPVAP
jgi:outer membrane protein assembly factor BamB